MNSIVFVVFYVFMMNGQVVEPDVYAEATTIEACELLASEARSELAANGYEGEAWCSAVQVTAI